MCPASATHIKTKVLLNVSSQYRPWIKKGNPNIRRLSVTLACLSSSSWSAVFPSCCLACVLLPEDLCPALHFLWLLFLPLTSDLSSLIPLLQGYPARELPGTQLVPASQLSYAADDVYAFAHCLSPGVGPSMKITFSLFTAVSPGLTSFLTHDNHSKIIVVERSVSEGTDGSFPAGI